MAEHILCSPITIIRPRSKPLALNLNVYRNLHFQALNGMKRKYKELMREQIELLPEMNAVSITYTLFPKTKRLCDISNVLSVVDKYFCDALTELGKIPDDNYLYVPEVVYRFGAVDKLNPRADILIKEI